MRILIAFFTLVFAATAVLAQSTPANSDESPVYKAGDAGITKPNVIKSVDPDFPAEARQGKMGGICVVQLTVDSDGKPKD